MEVISNIVCSKMWVKGRSGGVIFDDSSNWTFYYCIEGLETKTWCFVFYNSESNRLFLRSPIIDLKISHVILQSHHYLSNIYKLLLEWRSPTLQLWSTSKEVVTSTPKPFRIVTAALSQTYLCTPPIMFKDSFSPLKLTKTPFLNPMNFSDQQTTLLSAGYISYKGDPSDHTRHFLKTWIPSVKVNSKTFEVAFEVVYNETRRARECLECQCPQGSSWGPDVSNLLINH